MSEIEIFGPSDNIVAVQTSAFDRVLNDDFSGNADSKRAYMADMAFFASTFGFYADRRSAVEWLLNSGPGHANITAADYRARMVKDGVLAPNTINRRLSSLRKVVDLMRKFGACDFTIDVPNVQSRTYRDTKGPGVDNLRKLVEAARNQDNRTKAARDVAIIKLTFGLALRRIEVSRLTLPDWDVENQRIAIKGKGKLDTIWMTLPPDVTKALDTWVKMMPLQVWVGPLFPNFRASSAAQGKALSGDGIHDLFAQLSAKAGLAKAVRPHGVRHSAITEALDKKGGDVRAVQKMSRHAKVDTLLIYDDNRTDMAGDVSTLVSGALGDEE